MNRPRPEAGSSETPVEVPRLMAITPGRVEERPRPGPLDDPDEPFLMWLEALAEAGVDTVQVREKHLSDRRLLEVVVKARRWLPGSVRLLVNGRADVALAAGADGVHLPASGLPVAALRRRFGDRLSIGRSTHGLEEVEAAHVAEADWVTFGPVFPTPSKATYGPPPGLEGLRRAVAVGLPVIALGGVDGERLAAVADAGAAGAAGIRVFHHMPGLPAVVAEARRVFPRRGDRGGGGPGSPP